MPNRPSDLAEQTSHPLTGIMPLVSVFFLCLAAARIGAIIGRADEKIRKCLGLGIPSQAGVARRVCLILQREPAELHRVRPAGILPCITLPLPYIVPFVVRRATDGTEASD